MKIVGALIGLIFRLPFILLRNRVALIIVAGIIMAIVIVPRLGGSGSSGGSYEPPRDAPPYQLIAPDPRLAPHVIQTHSRVYYAATVEETDDVYTLLIWYEYNADKWERHTTPLPLNKDGIKTYIRGTN